VCGEKQAPLSRGIKQGCVGKNKLFSSFMRRARGDLVSCVLCCALTFVLARLSCMSLGWQLLDAVLSLLDEPSELSQWLCYDDSTINIVIGIISSNKVVFR